MHTLTHPFLCLQVVLGFCSNVVWYGWYALDSRAEGYVLRAYYWKGSCTFLSSLFIFTRLLFNSAQVSEIRINGYLQVGECAMNIVYRSDGALHFVNGECCLTHAQADLHTIVALEKALVHTAMTRSHTHSRNIKY